MVYVVNRDSVMATESSQGVIHLTWSVSESDKALQAAVKLHRVLRV